MVTLRRPTDGRWYGFCPRTLLFGATAAVLHYNGFSRIVAVLANILFGLPVVNYFDDIGRILPTSISDEGLSTFKRFCGLIGVRLKEEKAKPGTVTTFLGLDGAFPCPSTGMTLQINLTSEMKRIWAGGIRLFITTGRIQSKELESLTGRLSFSQTSVFGRYGRAMMQHLDRKSNAAYFDPNLSGLDIRCLEWWEGVIRSHTGRSAVTLKTEPDIIIYTDAATETMIMAGLVFVRSSFLTEGTILAIRTLVADHRWVDIFIKTNLIYGLELLAVVEIVADKSIPLGDKSITFYVDNNNALIALTKADSKREVIMVLARLFWAIVARRRITPWSGRVDSDYNIADVPTRNGLLPFPASSAKIFQFEKQLSELVYQAMEDQHNGFFDPDLLVGSLFP